MSEYGGFDSDNQPADSAHGPTEAKQKKKTVKKDSTKTTDKKLSAKKERSGSAAKTSFYRPATIVALTIGIFVFAQIVVALVIGLFALTTGQGEGIIDTILDSNAYSAMYVVSLALLQLLGIYVALRYVKKSFRDIGLVRPVARDLLRSGGGWLVYMVILAAAATLLGAAELVDFDQEQQIDFQRPDEQPIELLYIYISIVIAPAFIEEILMRGFLFFGLRKHMSFVKSTLIVSVIFGAAHLQPGTGEPLLWAAFVDTFILSTVLCWLTEKFRSLWPAIIIHGIKNSIAFTYLFVL